MIDGSIQLDRKGRAPSGVGVPMRLCVLLAALAACSPASPAASTASDPTARADAPLAPERPPAQRATVLAAPRLC